MTVAPQKTQVVIVGAGPTGLSLAAQLLRFGIDFIIIEKNEKTTHLSKAVVIQARTLEIFQEIGLAEKAIQRGRITTALNMFYKGKRRARLDVSGLGGGKSAFPFVLSLEQSKTENLLVEHLLENGKTILWKSEFITFTQDNSAAAVYYKNADGNQQEIQADYIVGCDGAGSLIRHKAGMTFEGDTIPKIFYVADVTRNSPVINKDELFIFLIKKGFILFFPMEGKGHSRIIGILPEMDESEAAELEFDDIKESIKQQVPVEFTDIRWFSHYKVHSRKADNFQIGRCFIAGDAAHIHTPAGGQGMNTGIQDAYNLAWKMAMVLNGTLHVAVLETYNSERMENAKRLLSTTDRMFDFMAGTDWFTNFVRLNIFPIFARIAMKDPRLNKIFFPLLSQIGIAYPNSLLTINSRVGKIKAGDRMHYFTFSDGSNIFDHLSKPEFKIIYFGKDNTAIKLPDVFGSGISTLSFSEIPKKIFGDSSDFYILVRPDNHISYIGKDIDKIWTMLKIILKKGSVIT